MRTPSRSLFSALVGLALLPPLLAFAHAILVRSDPAPHGIVPAKGFPVVLHFNSRIDGARSRITLTTKADPNKTLPLAALTQSAPDTLNTSSPAVAPGDYALHWIVLATDGHITRGELPFTAR